MTEQTIKVLLIEDNPGDALLLTEALRKSPDPAFRVRHVERLGEALAVLTREAFNVVLLDLSLPDSLGLDTFTRLHTRFPDIPVVLITGLSDETVAGKAVRQGAQDYLAKGQTPGPLLVRSIRYAMERQAAAMELSRVNRALKVLSECNVAMVQAADEADLLGRICRNLVEIGGYRMAWVGFAELDAAKSVRPVAQFGFDQGYLDTANITWADDERGREPTGAAIRTGRFRVGKDFLIDPELAPWREQARERGFASSIALPLLSDGQAFGALTVYAEEPNAFTDAEVKLLLEMAEDLAYGILALRAKAERKLAEDQILFTNSLLELFVKKATRKEYLDAVVRLVRTWSSCECVGIRLKARDNTVPYEAYTGFTRAFWRKENLLDLDRDQCVCTRAVRQCPDRQDKRFLTARGSFLCNDTFDLLASLSDRQKERYRGECVRSGFRTVVVIPIRYRKEILGAIHLADKRAHAIVPRTMAFFESAALLIGEAVHRFNVEESLQHSNELLERMFSGIHLLIAYLDTDLNFIRVNRAYAEADGRTEDFFPGKNHFDLYPNAENEAIFREVVATGRPYFAFGKPFEYAESPERGMTYWDWSLEPVRDATGKITGVVLSLLNVSEQKRLEKEILEISRREQRRIGQDLHDVLGQNLTGLAFIAKVLERKLREKSLPEAAEAGKITTHINQCINQARALARGLCPVDVKADGFMSALRQFAGTVQELFDVRCRFQCDAPILIQDNTAATHLFHIAQEAVNNAVKHGKAGEIAITLTATDGRLIMEIRDNGIGLPEKLATESGMGLRIMNYRAKMIGGSFEAARGPEGGTVIKCSFENVI